MRARLGSFLTLALGISLVTPGVAEAKPEITRSHHEFTVVIDDCGIDTLELSFDTFTVSQLTTLPSGDVLGHTTVTVLGTGLDPSSGTIYKVVDRFTQQILILGPDATQPFVETAERTFLLTGGSTGGLLSLGVVHMTVLPSGEVVSDLGIQSVRCL